MHDANQWKKAFNYIKANEKIIREYQWPKADANVAPLIDFDEIVNKHRNKDTINQLFNSLIESLEKLIQCEELDSRRVAEDLERLLVTLGKAEASSFNAQILSWSIARKYIKNLAASWLKETKAAKVIIRAAEKTSEELDLTIEEASNKMQGEISEIEDKLSERLSESAPKQMATAKTPRLAAESNLDGGDSGVQSGITSGQATQLPHAKNDQH